MVCIEHKQWLEIRLRGGKEKELDTARVLGTKLRNRGILPRSPGLTVLECSVEDW